MSGRNDNLAYPGSAWRPGQTFSPDAQKKMLRTSPSATQAYWWQALPDPTWDEKVGRTTFAASFGQIAAGGTRGEYRRVLQTITPFVLIQEERVLRKYFQAGTWETGDVAVGFDPEICALSEHDWLVPKGSGILPHQIGKPDTNTPIIDTRVFTQKEVLTRGESSVSGVGVVSVSGVAVTGTGTAFLTFFAAGDVFKTVTGLAARVVTVTSDVSLVIDVSTNLAGMAYSKGVDRLRYGPVARLISVRDEADLSYNPNTDVFSANVSGGVAPGTEGVLTWSSPINSPSPGTRYGIQYEHYTRYVITDLGAPGVVVAGIPMLSLVVGRLWKPDR